MTDTRSSHRAIGIITVALLALALLPLTTTHAAHPDGSTERIAGEDRFDTAARLARAAYPDGASTVLIANGTGFADALAAAALAGDRDAPLLLTRRDGLPTPSRAALDELNPDTVILLGETAVVSAAVEAALDDDYEVERIGGDTRFATARLIAEALESDIGTMPEGGPNDDDGDDAPGFGDDGLTTAILATGTNFPDAIAVGPLAFGGIHPVLLGLRDSLPTDTRTALSDEDLGIEQVVILGGSAVISQAVEQELRDELELSVIRVAGGDRTETAVEVATLTAAVLDDFGFTGDDDPLAVANGRAFPDALALASLAGTRASTIVLTQTPGNPGPFTTAFVAANCAGFGGEGAPIVVAGGGLAVTAETEAVLSETAVCEDFVPAGGLEIDPEEAATPIGTEDDPASMMFALEGVNGLGEPAEDAGLVIEVYELMQSPPDDPEFRFYQEGGQIFRRVQRQVFEDLLGFDGTATFTYFDRGRTAEDRVIVCAPPEPEDTDCVNEQGAIPETKYASVVATHHWTDGDNDENNNGADNDGGLPLP